ncbi:hypothetical protein G7Z17_g1657 [Cylindrodendrum hubeiense]|uniref:Uncharacterized protein n=1 Tax=Cylindrodendrum hubeiense TaxID=595255 RepID=A0A9P5HEG4_9HYPO|nr:hypothetical protein G7Z17_g1657 [Cylindrodendrum hubeiense]
MSRDTQDLNRNQPSIATSAEYCWESFSNLLDHLHGGFPLTQRLVNEYWQRYEAWIGFIGVGADDILSLDHRLRNSPEVKSLVLQQLHVTRKNLNAAIKVIEKQTLDGGALIHLSEEKNKASLSPALKAAFTGVEDALDRLHRLGVAIRQASAGQLISRTKAFANDDRVSSFEILAYSVLESMYPNANSQLLEHVTRSLASKYKEFVYRKERGKQYRPSFNPKRRPTPATGDPRIDAIPLRRPGSHRPPIHANNYIQPSVRSSAFDETEFNKNQHLAVPALEDYSRLTTSIQTGLASYLPPQIIPEGDKHANCDWCLENRPAEMFNTPSKWSSDKAEGHFMSDKKTNEISIGIPHPAGNYAGILNDIPEEAPGSDGNPANIPPVDLSESTYMAKHVASHMRTFTFLIVRLISLPHDLEDDDQNSVSAVFSANPTTSEGNRSAYQDWTDEPEEKKAPAALDLEEGIEEARQAIQSIANSHPDRPRLLKDLGDRLWGRYLIAKEKRYLEEAVEVVREAIQMTPDDSPDRLFLLPDLGVWLGERYIRTKSLSDLDESILCLRDSLKTTVEDHPNRVVLLKDLGARLADRYAATENKVDLDEAIHVTQEAVEIVAKDDTLRGVLIASLGDLLGDRYMRTQAESLRVLEEAIGAAREAVSVAPENYPDRAKLLTDLEEAIGITQEAVHSTPKDYPDWAEYANTLGILLDERYLHTGSIADLEEAIRMTQAAVSLTSEDHPDWAKWLNNISVRLGDKFSHTLEMADLEEAIRMAQEAVSAALHHHTDQAEESSNLAVRLGDKYSRGGAMADLDQAIHIAQEAVDTTPKNYPGWNRYANTLGTLLTDRYSHTGAIADLEKAIDIARVAISATPEDHPDWAKWSCYLGVQLRDRFLHSETIADLEDARRLFMVALDHQESPISIRITAGREFLSSLAFLEDNHQAFAVAKTTVELVPLCDPSSLHYRETQNILSPTAGFASDAAAIALKVGKGPVSAIELLETGRGLLASSLQDLRTDLSTLQRHYPELADSFVKLRGQLNGRTSQGALFSSRSTPISPQAQPSRRREAGSRMSLLLEEIRRKSGFQQFLLSISEAEMREAAVQGPIVILNASMSLYPASLGHIFGGFQRGYSLGFLSTQLDTI